MDLLSKENAVKVKDLEKNFGQKKIFTGFNLKVRENEVLGVQGKSGIGKTTLMRCIAGLEDYRGSINVQGEISYLFQDDRILKWLNAEKNILIPYKLRNQKITEKRYSEMIELAENLGVKDILNKPVRKISGGQRQRILVIRALVTDPDVLLLDEPFMSLDSDNRKKIQEQAVEMARETGTTTLISSHRKDLRQVTDRMINLEDKNGVRNS